ncbi:sulfotransferase [Aureispira]|nr:sulfotransferase [Aureispira sp.]
MNVQYQRLGELASSSTTTRWPDFVIIGSGKSGTTSLDHYINQHPEIFMSPFKEPNFFGFELMNENDFVNDPNELSYFKSSITNQEQYLQLFQNSSQTQKVGETSNTYMFHRDACQQLHYHIPNVKIIAILRQPTERLYSRFLHLARVGRLPTENFKDCLDKNNKIWWSRNDLIKEGFYYKHLTKYFKTFRPENIKIFFFEELANNPDKLMKDLYEFIGVDSSFEPDMSFKLNSSGYIKNKFYDSIFGEAKGLIKSSRALLPNCLYSRLKKNHFALKLKNRIREKNLHRPKLEIDLKKQVTEIYSDDITNLSRMINKDLSHWLC